MTNVTELPTDLHSAHFVINELTLKNQELQQQVDWFKRQIFGEKSEKVIHANERGPTEQLWIGGLEPKQASSPATTTIKEHVRKKSNKQALEDNCRESGLRFDSSVPVEEIPVPVEEIKGLNKSEYEVIDTKVTERLCQRAGSYYIKRFLRPVVKIHESEELISSSAPVTVLERSYADVSLLAGLLVDKFQYHLPLYRQHQRMQQAGIKIARANLTNWVLQTATLLEPTYKAVLISVLQSKVLAMDETPLKAGVAEKGKLHKGYVWALYGDKDEVAHDALLPSNKFQKAASYALTREQGLRVYLENPNVPIDTNHLEREIRPLPMGRKNCLFCWSEVGAQAVAIIQTLIACCKLQGISPFEYFVDVLQKIDSHPAARVGELTPRAYAAAKSEPK